MAIKNCFSVVGNHNSGKTTLIEELIKELKTRNLSVSTIKHAVHFNFNSSNKGDSERLFQAGSKTSIALFEDGTQLYTSPTKLRSALSYINSDILILEGFKGEAVPNIVRAKNTQDAKKLINELTIAIVTDEEGNLEDTPSFRPHQIREITEVALKHSFPPLPLLDCGHCKGGTCFKMASMILKGEGSIKDCVVLPSKVRLKVNNVSIPLNPFVEQIITSVVGSLVGILKDTTKEMKEIDLHIKL